MKREELSRVLPLFKVLAKINSEDRQVIIQFLNDEGCQGLYECIHNGVCNENLSKERRRIIRKQLIASGDQENCRAVLQKDIDPEERHSKLVKIGGAGLGLILNALIPVLAQHVSGK